MVTLSLGWLVNPAGAGRAVRRAVRAVRRAVRQAVRAARQAVMRCVNIYGNICIALELKYICSICEMYFPQL